MTRDGSWSAVWKESGSPHHEALHNQAGALTEALQLYASLTVPNLFQDYPSPPGGSIRILDACFGLGYNTWATWKLLAESLDQNPEFISAPYLIQTLAYEQFSEWAAFYPQILALESFSSLKPKIPPLEHNIYYQTLVSPLQIRFPIVTTSLQLDLYLKDLRNFVQDAHTSNLTFYRIFHDAFSPSVCPELWSVELFEGYARHLDPKFGLLITYSTAAAVRGALQEAGFKMIRIPGVGQKKDATVAALSQQALERVLASTPGASPLTLEEEAYLNSKAGIPYRDPALRDSSESVISRRQAEQAGSDRRSGKFFRGKTAQR
ncbi:MAG: hypothetical protein K2X01_02595 [Cyanobacteria bacterium]|nr:hypothetical protein [Cyanobacteriota bacterium]